MKLRTRKLHDARITNTSNYTLTPSPHRHRTVGYSMRIPHDDNGDNDDDDAFYARILALAFGRHTNANTIAQRIAHGRRTTNQHR